MCKKLYKIYIDHENTTMSIVDDSSEFLTNIYVIADSKIMALKIGANVIHKRVIEDGMDAKHELEIFKNNPNVSNLKSFSIYKITGIKECKDGYGEVLYTGTG